MNEDQLEAEAEAYAALERLSDSWEHRQEFWRFMFEMNRYYLSGGYKHWEANAEWTLYVALASRWTLGGYEIDARHKEQYRAHFETCRGLWYWTEGWDKPRFFYGEYPAFSKPTAPPQDQWPQGNADEGFRS